MNSGGAGGGGSSSSSTSSSSSSTWSSSSGSSASSSGSSSSSSSSSTSSSSSGSPTGVVLVLAGGGASIFAGEYHPGSGWTTGTLADATADAPAVALTGKTSAIGVIRSTGAGGEVRFTSWSPGAWTSFSALSANVIARAAPALSASGAAVSLAFQGADYKHYFGAHLASWSPNNEPVGGTANQSFGPSPASIATLGADAILAFAGNDHDLYEQTRSGGAWQGAHGHGLGDALLLAPTIVALTSGPDLMIAFVRSSDARVVYTTRTGSAWTAPAPIDANALSDEAVSLAALPGGGAVLAYRGQNGKAYWSRYAPTPSPSWTPPAGITATNYSTPSPPAVAPGVSGADAEMVFIDGATGAANHARLTGTTWSTPMPIGGSGLTRVAAASL